MSAGFDTIPHSYLLRKLQLLGYHGKTLKWVKSYLTGRTTRVKIETRISKPVKTKNGIPQGGPGSPGFWRKYTIDMIMTLHKSDEWDNDDKRDEIRRQKLEDDKDEGYWDDELSK